MLFLCRGSISTVSFDERERERENGIGFYIIQSISFSDDRSFKAHTRENSIANILSLISLHTLYNNKTNILGETSERGDVTTHRRILSRRGVREHF